MITIINALIIAIISAFIGYLFSIWKTRNRPWISLLGFDGEIRKIDEEIEIPIELSESFRKTLITDFIPSGKNQIGDVLDRYEPIQDWLKFSKSSCEILSNNLKKMKESVDEQDIAETIWTILNSPLLSNLLEVLTFRKILNIPIFDESIKIKVPFVKVDDDDGCFLFNFTTCTLKFGAEFNKMPFNQELLQPIAELIARIETDKLFNIFSTLEKMLKEQVEINDKILNETKSLINDYSRWSVGFNIINYGPTPFLIFADSARLYIKGEHIKPFILECHILQNNEENSTIINGAHCIESGITENLILVTKKRQGDIEGGGILRSAYETSKAIGFIKLKILGREIPIKRKVRSTKLLFSKE